MLGCHWRRPVGGAAVSRVERIGDATLYLGDALGVLHSLQGEFDAVITDPPYSSGGAFRGDRTVSTSMKYVGTEQRGGIDAFADFSGDNRDQRSFGLWSALWLGLARERCREGAIVCAFTDFRQLPVTTDALQAGGWIWRGIGVWDKTEAARPQKGRYRNQCEYFAWGSSGPLPDDGPCAPGVFRLSANSEEKFHIAGKPVALLEQMLQIVGAAILDPFMGSGTAGVAAVRAGRRYVGIEINPVHFEIACERIEAEHRRPRLALPEPVRPATQEVLL